MTAPANAQYAADTARTAAQLIEFGDKPNRPALRPPSARGEGPWCPPRDAR